MNIPNQVKIGGFTYDVERPLKPFIGCNGTTICDGEHSYPDKCIKVVKSGCAEYQDLVFLHEVCHAIISCYTSVQEQDEAFVEQFSKGLYQFLVDNPEIFTYEE